MFSWLVGEAEQRVKACGEVSEVLESFRCLASAVHNNTQDGVRRERGRVTDWTARDAINSPDMTIPLSFTS